MTQLKSLLFLLLFSIHFSVQADIVVNEYGEINGILNQLRAKAQGEDFWRDQLDQVKLELTRHMEAPLRKQRLNEAINNIEARSKRRREEFYSQYPEKRPSLVKQQADALRDQADDIESKELDAELEKRRLKRISTLQSIIKYIESR